MIRECGLWSNFMNKKCVLAWREIQDLISEYIPTSYSLIVISIIQDWPSLSLIDEDMKYTTFCHYIYLITCPIHFGHSCLTSYRKYQLLKIVSSLFWREKRGGMLSLEYFGVDVYSHTCSKYLFSFYLRANTLTFL